MRKEREGKSIDIRTMRAGQLELRAAQTEHKSYCGETDMEVDIIA